MDSNIRLKITTAEEDSCINCVSGVLVPNKNEEIDFAKCKKGHFNFNLYDDRYDGNLPRGNILSRDNLPCNKKDFVKYNR